MPAFVKTPQDEKDWQRSKDIVHEQYPKLKETNDKFWAITNKIFHEINGEDIEGTKG